MVYHFHKDGSIASFTFLFNLPKAKRPIAADQLLLAYVHLHH